MTPKLMRDRDRERQGQKEREREGGSKLRVLQKFLNPGIIKLHELSWQTNKGRIREVKYICK